MNLIDKKPLSMGEALDYINDFEDRKPLEDYFKKFVKIEGKKAKVLAGEVRELNNPKIKEEDIMKVCDMVPKSSEELNKIFNEVSLTEEEANKILEITKKY